ncbi:MAG: thrombospondin type 3 repeat-containing protein [Deltaproteobacteria bacterium]|nr:thrombospondin type 3 repeat-containing protein [Deltaproteobacteria bacterium]
MVFHAAIVRGVTRNVPGDYATIQAAIDAAGAGDTVLVADGIYRGASNVEVDFKGKAITVQSANGPSTCIIDGEDDLVRGFIFDTNEVGNSVLSGFSITNCGWNAIDCAGSSPTIINCSFIDNGKSHLGNSAIFMSGGSPTITNCSFNGNSAEWEGGAIQSHQSNPTISHCTFTGNSTQHFIPGAMGGAMFCAGGSPIIIDCTFTGNSSLQAGAIFLSGSDPGVITNCTFTGNTAETAAGAVFLQAYSAIVTNCTFSGNVAKGLYGGGGGGAIVASSDSDTITNCILWNDTPDEILDGGGAAPVVTYSDVDGAGVYPGEGNINTDPLFVGGGDYHLSDSSPCIDAGNDSAPWLRSTDIDGEARITDVPPLDVDTGSVDMGVDEYLDSDGDGVPDRLHDLCPYDPNKINDIDSDGDGILDCNDVCSDDPDNDIDGDGVCGDVDNCSDTPNADQTDSDADTIGDSCDDCPSDNNNDVDRDGVCGDVDNCPDTSNADQADADADGIGDACEICTNDPDNDADGDDLCANVDNCPKVANADQADSDGDGIGDACESVADRTTLFPPVTPLIDGGGSDCFIDTAARSLSW